LSDICGKGTGVEKNDAKVGGMGNQSAGNVGRKRHTKTKRGDLQSLRQGERSSKRGMCGPGFDGKKLSAEDDARLR